MFAPEMQARARRRLRTAKSARSASANDFPPGRHLVDVVEVRSPAHPGGPRRARCIGRAGRRIWLEDRRLPRLGARIRIDVQYVGHYRLMLLADGGLAAEWPDGSLTEIAGDTPPEGEAVLSVVEWTYVGPPPRTQEMPRGDTDSPIRPTETGGRPVEA